MKNIRYAIPLCLILLAMTLILSACGQKEADMSGGIKEEEILQALQYFSGTMETIKADQTVDVSMDISQDEQYDMKLYTFVPDQTGIYDIELSVAEKSDRNISLSIVDDNGNILNTYPDTRANLLAGQEYYLVCYAQAAREGTRTSSVFQFTLKYRDPLTGYEEIAEGENSRLAQKGVDNIVTFIPKESGYYSMDVYCQDDDYGSAAIEAVLKEGQEDVYDGYHLCYLEKDTSYFIVYDVFETQTEEAKVCIMLEPYDLMQMDNQEVIKTDKNLILQYRAKDNQEILLYSISEGDPQVMVFNDALNIIAENSDGDGEYSKNKHDFAVIMTVEKNKEYLLLVKNVEGHTCEIHIEKI